jgi:S1-C subfamily serine protease
MTPSYTGAVLEKMGPQLAGFFGVQGSAGLLVRSIEANSPAAMAGMRAGDVVVRANAHAVGSLSEWAKTIKEAKGRPVTVVVMRDRAEQTLTLTPDSKRRSSVEGTAEPVVASLML